MAAREPRSNGSNGETRERLMRHGRELKSESAALAESARAVASDLAELSRAQLERSPYVTLGSAFALGYVLGGGLPARLVMAAARMGMLAALEAVVAGSAGAQEAGAEAAAEM